MPSAGQHDGGSRRDTIDVGAVGEQLAASALGRITDLTDTKLDSIPPDGGVGPAMGKVLRRATHARTRPRRPREASRPPD
jgi:hypothetical protein